MLLCSECLQRNFTDLKTGKIYGPDGRHSPACTHCDLQIPDRACPTVLCSDFSGCGPGKEGQCFLFAFLIFLLIILVLLFISSHYGRRFCALLRLRASALSKSFWWVFVFAPEVECPCSWTHSRVTSLAADLGKIDSVFSICFWVVCVCIC